jgi:hypothetical protein
VCPEDGGEVVEVAFRDRRERSREYASVGREPRVAITHAFDMCSRCESLPWVLRTDTDWILFTRLIDYRRCGGPKSDYTR